MSVEVVSESLHFSRRPPVLLVLALCALLCRHMTRQQMQTVYSHLRYRSNPLGVFASLRFVTAAFIAPFSQTFTSNSVNLPPQSKGHIFQRLPENICKHAKAPYTHTIKRYSAGGMMREEVGAVGGRGAGGLAGIAGSGSCRFSLRSPTRLFSAPGKEIEGQEGEQTESVAALQGEIDRMRLQLAGAPVGAERDALESRLRRLIDEIRAKRQHLQQARRVHAQASPPPKRANSARLKAAADAPSQESGGMEGGGVTQKKAKNRGRKRRGVDSVGDELHNRKVQRLVAREEETLDARTYARELGMEGILAVAKPLNWSSFDVVNKLRSTLQRRFFERHPDIAFKNGRIKVGHGGTLDPQATGVLVVGVGGHTKLMDKYTKGAKGYETVIELGYETDTHDSVGKRVGEAKEWQHVTPAALSEAIRLFVGDIMQVPPNYSALKIKGERAYDLARCGVDFELKPRPVTVYDISMLRPYELTAPEIHLSISCSGGTYIRSIARDLGRQLASAAHMKTLVRTKQGEFALDDCLAMSDIESPDAIVHALKSAAPKIQHHLLNTSAA